MTSLALTDHHQDPEASDDEARLVEVVRTAKTAIVDRLAKHSHASVSPIVVDLLTRTSAQNGSPATLTTLLEHCQGPQPFVAKPTHRRRIATLMDLQLVAFVDPPATRATRLTTKGQATVCKILAGMAEGLLGQAGGG